MNYKSLLYEIQAAKINKGPGIDAIIVPSNTQLYNVDLKTRTIDAPENLSVKTEHYAETVYFLVDRFYDNMDLAQTNCIIQYTTSEGSYVYNVPFCDVTTYDKGIVNEDGKVIDQHAKMIIPWSISGSATKNAGTIKYLIRFYMIDENSVLDEYGNPTHPDKAELSYSLSTLTAKSKILDTLPIEVLEEEYHINENNRYFELINTINAMVDNATIYWNEV